MCSELVVGQGFEWTALVVLDVDEHLDHFSVGHWDSLLAVARIGLLRNRDGCRIL